MEALQKKTAEMAQILNRDSPIDPYFKQFNGTTCVEHPGVYEHKYKTSAGFSGAAKLFTRQVSLPFNLKLIFFVFRFIDTASGSLIRHRQ